jgi:hypothetical protein
VKVNKFVGPHSNPRFYARDFRNAYRFRPDVSPPRQKFQGYVNFVYNRDVLQFLANNNMTFKTSMSSLVRTATLPSMEFNTEIKNQYNKKKIVNSGVTFKPCTVTALDTVDNEWLTILMKYYAYMYMNPRNKNRFGDRDIEVNKDNIDELINSSFGGDTFASNEMGLNLQREANFFDRIDIILYAGGKGVQYSMTKPFITDIQMGSLDYADSTFMDFQISFDYENFTVYDRLNFDLTDVDLDRFEDMPDGYQFQGDDSIIKPLGLSDGAETDLNFLGNKGGNISGSGDKRPRTAQPQSPKATGNGGGDESGFFGDFLKDAIGVIATKPTYDDYETSLKNKLVADIGDGIINAFTRGSD